MRQLLEVVPTESGKHDGHIPDAQVRCFIEVWPPYVFYKMIDVLGCFDAANHPWVDDVVAVIHVGPARVSLRIGGQRTPERRDAADDEVSTVHWIVLEIVDDGACLRGRVAATLES